MTNTRRAGIALPLAIFAIVILGVAAASGSFVERTDARVAHDSRLHAIASTQTELASVAALEDLTGGEAIDIPVGGSVHRRHSGPDPSIRTIVRLTRLGETLFSLLSISEVDGGRGVGARDASQLLARIDAVEPPLASAIASRDPPTVSMAVIDGRDDTGGDPNCPSSASDDRPLAPAPDSVSLDSTLSVLRARATKRYSAPAAVTDLRPSVQDGRCDESDARNWGDPSSAGACASYLPAIHAAGDLSVQGGVGQGVLIVDGDLELGGAFEFAGLILVGGTMSIVGGGASVTGGIVAAGIDLASAGSDVVIRRSTCRVRRALLAAAPLVAVAERPWSSVR